MKKLSLILMVSLIMVVGFSGNLYSKKVSFDGTWNGSTMTPDGMEMGIVMVFKTVKGKISGTISDDAGMMGESEIKDIKVKDATMKCYFDFSNAGGESKILMEFTVKGDKMTGTWEMETDGSTGEFEFTKEKKKKK